MDLGKTLLITARIAALLNLAALSVLFISAGQLVQHTQGLDLHGLGAIALHVFTGLLALALVIRAVLTRTGGWPAAGAGALFAMTFVQASLGSYLTLDAHIAGSLVAAVLCTWLSVWTFTPQRASTNSPVKTAHTQPIQERTIS